MEGGLRCRGMMTAHRNLSNPAVHLNRPSPLGLHAGGGGWSRDRLHNRRQQPSLRRGATATNSPKDDNDEGKDRNKADFSAYWATKIRETFVVKKNKFMGEMKKYGIDAFPPFPPLYWLFLLKEQIAWRLEIATDEKEALDKDKEKLIMELEKERMQRRERLKEKQQGGVVATMGKEDINRVMAKDIDLARESLRVATIYGPGMNMIRARKAIRAVLVLPMTLFVAYRQWWAGLFETQRYENFILREGERLWYWRNRMENERWFWNIIMWERLLYPVVFWACFEYLVPDSLFWSVIMPAVMIVMRTGHFPTPNTLEFWLVAYFGLYAKCWDQALTLFAMAQDALLRVVMI